MMSNLLLLWIGGLCLGVVLGINITTSFSTDTGERCMLMYEEPAAVVECLKILNNGDIIDAR
jgi:hypothetical protein